MANGLVDTAPGRERQALSDQSLPEPLVPPEVDLRDYDYIPLYGDRLFNSDTWALCDADEKVAALRLWWRAWHEEPAGSLPNNDRLLADRAGYGVAVKAFLRVKPNSMRGWVECSDGRLYHPVVASIALDVWRTKRRKRAENEADRQRKQIKRGLMSAGQPTYVRPDNRDFPPDSNTDKPHLPPDVQPENPLKGKRREVEGSLRSPNARAIPAGFAEWYAAYPHKVGRAGAIMAYRRALARASPEILLEGLARYIAGKPPQRAWCGPAVWLNNDRWLDQPAENDGRKNGNGSATPGPITQLYAGFAAAVGAGPGDRWPHSPPDVPLLDRQRK